MYQTTLQARDINGDTVVDAYYDTVLNITWLANWNANGPMDWDTAVAWAAGLNVHGITGWRLPTVTDTGAAGCNFSFAGGTDCGYNVDTSTGEMAHMFYVTLGNLAFCPPGDATCAGGPQTGFGLTNTADFVDMQSTVYWSGTEYASSTVGAWVFDTNDGNQRNFGKTNALYAVAVRPGDVAAVPEPQTFALAPAALAALRVARRRRPSRVSSITRPRE